MEKWFDSYVTDGFNFTPMYKSGGVREFVELVIPELQRRRRFRMAYDGSTLGENLGLPRVPNPWERAS